MSRAMAARTRDSRGCAARSEPLVGAAQFRQQRLDAAGQLRLLLREPQRRLDVDHQVLVARARQALHQLLDLRALQRHFAQARFGQRLPRRGLARQFLRLLGHGARLDRVGAAVGALARQLLLDVGELLPEHARWRPAPAPTAPGRSTACPARPARRAAAPAHRRRGVGIQRRDLADGGGFAGGLGTHRNDSRAATTASRAGRDSQTTPKPALARGLRNARMRRDGARRATSPAAAAARAGARSPANC